MKIKNNPLTIAIIIIVMMIFFISVGTIAFLSLNGTLGDINSALNGDYNLNSNNNNFLMAIEDVKSSSGSIIVYGNIEKGKVKIGDEVQIIGYNFKSKKIIVKGIEIVKRNVNSAEKGQSNVGIKFDVQELNVVKGQVLAAPETIKSHKNFEASITVLTQDKNKIETVITNNMRPVFRIRTADVGGTLKLLDNKEEALCGEKDVKISVSLNDDIALEIGTEFYIVSNGKTIARGSVTKVY